MRELLTIWLGAPTNQPNLCPFPSLDQAIIPKIHVPSTNQAFNNHKQGDYSHATRIILCPQLAHPYAIIMSGGDWIHALINEFDSPIQN